MELKRVRDCPEQVGEDIFCEDVLHVVLDLLGQICTGGQVGLSRVHSVWSCYLNLHLQENVIGLMGFTGALLICFNYTDVGLSRRTSCREALAYHWHRHDGNVTESNEPSPAAFPTSKYASCAAMLPSVS